MATRITDVIDPEILSDIVIRGVTDNIGNMPGVYMGDEFSEGDPGTYWEVIYGNKLGDLETYDPDTPLTAQKLTQGKYGHVVVRKAGLYGVDKIVKKAAKKDPTDYFGTQLVELITDTVMTTQINILEGAIPSGSRVDNDAVMDTDEVNSAKYVLGDKASKLKWIVMHSKTFQVLDKAGEIVYQPINNILPLSKPTDKMQVITNSQMLVATIGGLIIWQTDKMPIISGSPDEYVSYLLGDRAMGMYNQGSLNVDFDYDITTKQHYISPDFDYLLSLHGTNYTDAPDYDETSLATTGNYTTVWNIKEIPAVRLLTRIA